MSTTTLEKSEPKLESDSVRCISPSIDGQCQNTYRRGAKWNRIGSRGQELIIGCERSEQSRTFQNRNKENISPLQHFLPFRADYLPVQASRQSITQWSLGCTNRVAISISESLYSINLNFQTILEVMQQYSKMGLKLLIPTFGLVVNLNFPFSIHFKTHFHHPTHFNIISLAALSIG